MAASSSSSSAAAANRLHVLQRQLVPRQSAQTFPENEPVPQRDVRLDGWGYADTAFKLEDKTQRMAKLTGERYLFSGQNFPNFVPWIESICSVDVDHPSPATSKHTAHPPIRNEAFLSAINGCFVRISFDDKDRIFHGHGHTCQEIYAVRFGELERVPDVVIWPGNQIHVERLVHEANIHNVCLIPFGGGTSVSGALECPADERRMIVSVDMHEMNSIKWIDRANMTVCAEAGIVGQDLVRRLEKEGLCVGHEPDSLEFSTLGGWVATRASGMKKNVYGNIDDLLVGVTIVTPLGTMEKSCAAPRISAGPDLHHVVMGSEGTLGIITQAILKLRPVPEAREYGSILFPSFSDGVKCLREIALQRCSPASLRVVDNTQFQFAMALKPEQTSVFHAWVDAAKKFYVTQIKGFKPEEMVVATVLYEGDKSSVALQMRKVTEIAARFNGMNAGPENGHRGYFLTYVIAYLRDFGLEYNFISESFETSAPWDCVEPLCAAVKARIIESCAAQGIKKTPFVSCRVSQVYDAGACIYFYVGFEHAGVSDPVQRFNAVYSDARDEIILQGGSISHHHGVGKHRKQWLPQSISPVGIQVLQGLKRTIDPKNIFGNRNLVDTPAL